MNASASASTNASAMWPFHFGPLERRLFGIHHPASTRARAVVVFCPALLHEHMRSYRFFSELALHLANAGVDCLRFDYYGSGDSDGDGCEFRLAGAVSDIVLAATAARAKSPSLPLYLFGIRASASLACMAASRAGAAAIWLWQPVVDGRVYLAALQQRDCAERASTQRYPLRRTPAPGSSDALMGFRLAPSFGDELACLRLPEPMPVLPLTVLDAAAAAPVPGLPAHRRIVLPESTTRWAQELDLSSIINIKPALPMVAELLDAVPAWPERMAV